MYVSKSMTFPTPHKGHSRHGLFFTRLDCQSNAKPSEKDHDLLGIRTWDLWSSSQHTQPLIHLLSRHDSFIRAKKNYEGMKLRILSYKKSPPSARIEIL
jgi:hypothetical protein